MKKTLFFLFVLLGGLSHAAFTQTATISIDDVITTPGLVNVPVTLDAVGANGLGSFTLYITYDNPELTYSSVISNIGTIAPVVVNAGEMSFAWSEGGVIAPQTLFTIVFNAADDSPVAFNTTGSQWAVSDNVGPTAIGPTSLTLNNGSVTVTTPVPLTNWAIFIGLGLIIAFLVVRFRRIV